MFRSAAAHGPTTASFGAAGADGIASWKARNSRNSRDLRRVSSVSVIITKASEESEASEEAAADGEEEEDEDAAAAAARAARAHVKDKKTPANVEQLKDRPRRKRRKKKKKKGQKARKKKSVKCECGQETVVASSSSSSSSSPPTTSGSEDEDEAEAEAEAGEQASSSDTPDSGLPTSLPSTAHTSHASASSSSASVVSGFSVSLPAKDKDRAMRTLREQDQELDRIDVVEEEAPKPAQPPKPLLQARSYNQDLHLLRREVSMLVLEGCQECEERLGIRDDAGLKPGERFKSHTDPDNWTFGSPAPSNAPTSLTRSSGSVSSERSRPLFTSEPPPESLGGPFKGRMALAPAKTCRKSAYNVASAAQAKEKQEGVTTISISEVNEDPTPHATIPTYIQNILLHHSHSVPKREHDAHLLKQLSKRIFLPEDPADPAAFTVTPGLTRAPKAPWCSSKPVLKIVGTFALLMTLTIVALIIYFNWSRNTFKPMNMR